MQYTIKIYWPTSIKDDLLTNHTTQKFIINQPIWINEELIKYWLTWIKEELLNSSCTSRKFIIHPELLNPSVGFIMVGGELGSDNI